MTKWSLTMLLCVSLAGCGGGGGGGSTSSPLAGLDITDARSLYISQGTAGTPTGVTSADGSEHLFKITKDGYIEQVTFTDAEGNDVTTSYTPFDVFAAGPDYVVVGFNSGSAYLVRKSDGKAFAFEGGDYPADWIDQGGERFRNRNAVRSDGAGNLYYVARGDSQSIYKIDLTNPDKPVRTRVTPATDWVWQFAVSQDGLVAYVGSPGSRVVSPSGQLTNLPSTTEDVWAAPDGSLQFFGSVNNNYTEISQVINSGDTVTTTKYGDLPVASNGFSMIYFIHELNGKLYRVEWSGSSSERLIVELTNDLAQPRLIPGLPIASANASAATASRIIVAGTTATGDALLISVDPATDSYTDLLTPNTYDVYALSASADGVITFSALRLSDGAKVLGQIDPFGNVQILSSTLSTEVSVLVPVN